jgi:hypothetical protein
VLNQGLCKSLNEDSAFNRPLQQFDQSSLGRRSGMLGVSSFSPELYLISQLQYKKASGVSFENYPMLPILSGKRILQSFRLLSRSANERIEVIYGFSFCLALWNIHPSLSLYVLIVTPSHLCWLSRQIRNVRISVSQCDVDACILNIGFRSQHILL